MMLVASYATMCAQTEITNATILEWIADEGITDDDIINELGNTDNTLNVKMDINFRKQLNQAGASDALKTAIDNVVKDQKYAIAHADDAMIGVYYQTDDDQWTDIPLNTFSIEEKKSLGLGGIARIAGGTLGVIGGIQGDWSGLSKVLKGATIAGMGSLLGDTKFKSDRLKLDNSHASQKVKNVAAGTPMFRFYFPKIMSQDAEAAWYYTLMGNITTPRDFLCVRLTSNEKKKKRTFPAGKKLTLLSTDSGFSAGDGSGDIVEFDIKKVKDNVFEISFPNGIEPGEYCFYYKNFKNEILKDHLPAFDFAVE